jgi:hypothetical protein
MDAGLSVCGRRSFEEYELLVSFRSLQRLLEQLFRAPQGEDFFFECDG